MNDRAFKILVGYSVVITIAYIQSEVSSYKFLRAMRKRSEEQLAETFQSIKKMMDDGIITEEEYKYITRDR